MGLEFRITLAGAGPLNQTQMIAHHTYGATTPLGGPDLHCVWDCGGDNDNNVGIVDFLALLGEWDQVGTPCDFDGGGVGIVDFLELLANWGACP